MLPMCRANIVDMLATDINVCHLGGVADRHKSRHYQPSWLNELQKGYCGELTLVPHWLDLATFGRFPRILASIWWKKATDSKVSFAWYQKFYLLILIIYLSISKNNGLFVSKRGYLLCNKINGFRGGNSADRKIRYTRGLRLREDCSFVLIKQKLQVTMVTANSNSRGMRKIKIEYYVNKLFMHLLWTLLSLWLGPSCCQRP